MAKRVLSGVLFYGGLFVCILGFALAFTWGAGWALLALVGCFVTIASALFDAEPNYDPYEWRDSIALARKVEAEQLRRWVRGEDTDGPH